MNVPMRVGNMVSVIIPVHKAAAGLETTLLALAAQQPIDRAMAVLVANDGSDAAVTTVCRRHGVSMVAIQPRRGSYFARNRALEMAKSENIVFLDAGIHVPPGWLTAALRALGDADYLACEVDVATISRPTAAQAYELQHSYPIAEYLRSQHYGVTAGLLVTRRLLEAVDGFDERLLSGGDLEFGDRVHRAGFRQAYLAAPALLHAPRRAWPFMRKQFRVRIGYGRLARLYQQRFDHPSSSSAFFSLLRSILPPRPRHIDSEFPAGTTVAAWRRYLFLWVLKLCRAAADLAAVLAPPPRKKAARIEHCDFSTDRD